MKHLSLKFALFGALFFLPVIISGCLKCDFCGGDCNCDELPKTHYALTALNGITRTNWEAVKPNKPYKYDSLWINIESTFRFYAQRTPKQYGGASLWATPPCACDNEGAKGAKEQIKKITIKSNASFRNDYPAGTDIASLMSMWDFALYESLYQPKLKKAIAMYLSQNPQPPQSVRLFFDFPPTQDKKHIFTIRYELDNGEVYTYTTPEITFQ